MVDRQTDKRLDYAELSLLMPVNDNGKREYICTVRSSSKHIGPCSPRDRAS